MNYEILNNNYGASYTLKLGNDKYALINIDTNDYFEEDIAVLEQFGMWHEVKAEDISADDKNKIEAILNSHI